MEKDTRDLVLTVAAVIAVVAVLIGGSIAFAGMYPPFTVVNSGSMQHSDESEIGVIDAGDMMIVQKNGKHDITTYVEGSSTGYEKFGEFGDVLVYDHPDRKTNIIHRAMLEMELTASDASLQKWHIPSLKNYENWEYRNGFGEDRKEDVWNEDEGLLTIDSSKSDYRLTLTHVGYSDATVSMPIWPLGEGKEPGYHGYLTKGDNADTNRTFDQNGIVNGLVTDDMIVSTAEIEIPWIGSVKLLLNKDLAGNVPSNSITNLVLTLIAIVAAVLLIGYAMDRMEKSKKTSENDENTYVRKSKQRK